MEQNQRYLAALAIAGSDSGGGAGIQADLKTFSSLGVFGTSAITAITAQNTRLIRAVEVLSPETVRRQIETVLDDIPIDVVKTGMLPTPEIIDVVAQAASTYGFPHLVVDPVLSSTSGTSLTTADIICAYRELLYTHITLITPNIPEATQLSGVEIQSANDMRRAAETLLEQGCRAVLVKGGHLSGQYASDTLFTSGEPPVSFSTEFIASPNLHGTGCTLASAIASYLASGHGLAEAVKQAKQYVTSAIAAGRDIFVGYGNGPLNHFFDPQPLKTKKV